MQLWVLISKDWPKGGGSGQRQRGGRSGQTGRDACLFEGTPPVKNIVNKEKSIKKDDGRSAKPGKSSHNSTILMGGRIVS